MYWSFASVFVPVGLLIANTLFSGLNGADQTLRKIIVKSACRIFRIIFVFRRFPKFLIQKGDCHLNKSMRPMYCKIDNQEKLFSLLYWLKPLRTPLAKKDLSRAREILAHFFDFHSNFERFQHFLINISRVISKVKFRGYTLLIAKVSTNEVSINKKL